MREKTITNKYCLAGFPTRFLGNVIHQFHKKLIDKQIEYELIIRDFSFAQPKKFIFVKIPFCVSNENSVKRFLDKLQIFVHHKFETWWKEYENQNKDSEPAKQPRDFPCHKFDCKILLTATTKMKLSKIYPLLSLFVNNSSHYRYYIYINYVEMNAIIDASCCTIVLKY